MSARSLALGDKKNGKGIYEFDRILLYKLREVMMVWETPQDNRLLQIQYNYIGASHW